MRGWTAYLVCMLFAFGVGVACGAEEEARAGLLFRALDLNHDKAISGSDLEHVEAEEVLRRNMPGVEPADFHVFLELADKDGDGALSRGEFMHAMERAQDSATVMIERAAVASKHKAKSKSKSKTKRSKRAGFLGNTIKSIASSGMDAMKRMGLKIMGKVDKTQDGCVMCQYIVERIETNLKASMVVPANNAMQQGTDFAVGPSYLETEAKTGLPDSAQVLGAGVIDSTRQVTRYQRAIERQKFNSIYRVTDVTLDDVCEQGMPPSFYGYCKAVYQQQTEIVDGLRYQYRPTDICYRIGMCKKNSYITKGMHSPYKGKNSMV